MDAMELFTTEEVAEYATGNALGFIAGSMSFLRDRGIAVEDWVTFVGERFVPGWEDMRQAPAEEIAKAMVLNIVSCGGQLVSLRGSEVEAEAAVRWLPEHLRDDDLDEADAMKLRPIFEPIAKSLGLTYEVIDEPGIWRFRISR